MLNPFKRDAAHRDGAHRYKAAATIALETATAKLAAAEVQLAEAESTQRELSLPALLSDDPDSVLADADASVARAKTDVKRARDAVDIAQRNENARLAEARREIERARIRAIKTHAASAVKACVEIRESTTRGNNAWQDLLRVTEKIEKLLDPGAAPGAAGERLQMFGFGAVENILAGLVRLEAARQCGTGNDARTFPLARGVSLGGLLPHGKHPSECPPIDEAVRARFDISAVTTPPAAIPAPRPAAAPPAPEPMAEPASPPLEQAAPVAPPTATAGDDWHLTEMQRYQRLQGGEIILPSDDGVDAADAAEAADEAFQRRLETDCTPAAQTVIEEEE